jgi:cytochrome c biogenesis protein CcmG/thiol:disulfide interchange protein DsbE|tara:strand:+ start:618 stop:1148 length:531 start_codon:yes stop_codon:yes gene_type:complete
VKKFIVKLLLSTAVVSLGFSPTMVASDSVLETSVKVAPTFAELESLKGKPVLVDFWASWCGPCRESFPWMDQIKKKYPELQIIAINLDEDRADADDFLLEMPTEVNIVFDPEGELAEKYRVDAMPSSYLIDANGNIVVQHTGFFADKTAEYETSIKQLLADPVIDTDTDSTTDSGG